MTSSVPSSPGNAVIVYDGDCIFCQNYVKLVRLRDTVGKVDLVDARSDDPRVPAYKARGFDLNEGMIFDYKGQVYHGSDAVHVLGTLSTSSGFFNKLNNRIFSSKVASKVLYPWLKLGRRATLLLRGKKLIGA